MTDQNFYKAFFIKYGILMGFMAFFFLVTIYSTVIARKSWKDNLKVAIEKVLEEHEPNTWSLENYVRIENPFAMNMACYEARNRTNGEVSYAVIMRAQTFYGPLPAVFLVSKDRTADFVGISSFHGRFLRQIQSNKSSARIDYWKRRVAEILENEKLR